MANFHKGELILCPRCYSEDIKKAGFRYSVYRGKIQRYKCGKCDRKFTMGGIYRFPEEIITYCLSEFDKGRALRKISKEASERFGIPLSASAVHYWAIKINSYEPLNMNKRFLSQLRNLKRLGKQKKKQNRFIDERNYPIKTEDLKTELLVLHLRKQRVKVVELGIVKKENRYYWTVDYRMVCEMIMHLKSKPNFSVKNLKSSKQHKLNNILSKKPNGKV